MTPERGKEIRKRHYSRNWKKSVEETKGKRKMKPNQKPKQPSTPFYNAKTFFSNSIFPSTDDRNSSHDGLKQFNPRNQGNSRHCTKSLKTDVRHCHHHQPAEEKKNITPKPAAKLHVSGPKTANLHRKNRCHLAVRWG